MAVFIPPVCFRRSKSRAISFDALAIYHDTTRFMMVM